MSLIRYRQPILTRLSPHEGNRRFLVPRRFPWPDVADNLLVMPEAFDTAAWSKGGGVVVTADGRAAPDGTNTADLAHPASAGDVYQRWTADGPETVNLSFFLWAASSSSGLELQMWSEAAGAFAFVGGFAPPLQQWVRVWAAIDIPAPQVGVMQCAIAYAAGSADVYMWGAQLTLGSRLVPYQAVSGWQSPGGFNDLQVLPLVADAGGPYQSLDGRPVSLRPSWSGSSGPYTFLWEVSPAGPQLSDPTDPYCAVSFDGLPAGPHAYTLTFTVTDSAGRALVRSIDIEVHPTRKRVPPYESGD